MSKILENLKYSKSHEWVKVDGKIATIGISDYAQHSLGNVVYVEANEVGEITSQFEPCGVIESVKAASDILAPVSGKIIAVNNDVVDSPELINEDCYSNWILKVELSNPNELEALLDAKSYQAECH
ncbi:MAG: glycine cleavage system protein GcvH [Bacilli bacterium]|jgi:glycine cleavage system H protein|nr:glycine cleavage system protein GcvH [Bacilli bacterium]MDY0064247.1 glycine cleavage system protein GcvH [Bacilli bacterium]